MPRDNMQVVSDHRIPGMVTYPLDEVLLVTLVGVVCGAADDWDGVEEVAMGALDWLRGFLPFSNGIPTAQTLRKVFRLLDTQALQRGFAAWAASLHAEAREVIAMDGKTPRGSKTSPDGKGTGQARGHGQGQGGARAQVGRHPASHVGRRDEVRRQGNFSPACNCITEKRNKGFGGATPGLPEAKSPRRDDGRGQAANRSVMATITRN